MTLEDLHPYTRYDISVAGAAYESNWGETRSIEVTTLQQSKMTI